ncbi:hypothetical protein DLM75_18640 [Leptospira stimsonii]|uniref:Uncharacterized protein n=1 Tax=Leptospira stimsonii TaxID=2202203 RepID=A0A396Z0E8_9LEPT|nr:hypothetical protein DLM75_18640 [Leptospira stimsonii]
MVEAGPREVLCKSTFTRETKKAQEKNWSFVVVPTGYYPFLSLYKKKKIAPKVLPKCDQNSCLLLANLSSLIVLSKKKRFIFKHNVSKRSDEKKSKKFNIRILEWILRES